MSQAIVESITPPSFPLLPLEFGRVMLEASTLPAASLLLRGAPKGDGHPVLVCPPFMASDGSTSPLRQFLSKKNYSVHGWNLGRNLGPQVAGENSEFLLERLSDLYDKSKRKVTLIGWSLGGVLARELAKTVPGKIRQVITLGSPISGRLGGVTGNIRSLFSFVSGYGPEHPELNQALAKLHRPPEGVPSTAIYSKTDGIVAWRSCLEPASDFTDNIEVHGSHCGLGVNASVFFAVADRLAAPEGDWRPFDRKAAVWRRTLFPSSGHD
ncbi:MAG: alpha/beta fold hydrolase [Pseudomonadota bacterium]